MDTGENNTDWNKVAATLDFILGWHPNVQFNTKNVEKAISLCERMAKGELVERSDVAAFSLNYKRRLRYCTCDQQCDCERRSERVVNREAHRG